MRAGKKWRGLGGGNFLPASRPFPQEHGGRGVWGEFRHALAKIEASPAACSFRAEHQRKVLFSF